MPALNHENSPGPQTDPEGKSGKPDINLQDLAEHILELLKKEARIEQERLGKKPRRIARR